VVGDKGPLGDKGQQGMKGTEGGKGKWMSNWIHSPVCINWW
jgi:hypothetical protein